MSLKLGSASLFDQRSFIACLPWTHLPSLPDTYASSAMKLMNWSTFFEPAAFAQSWSAFFRSSVGLAARARNALNTTNRTTVISLRILHLHGRQLKHKLALVIDYGSLITLDQSTIRLVLSP